ncbi:MAG: threonine-phosphate decarboxylase [Leptolyngbya foveolarum]|uniref:threonine-phosphate decarboxylase n=1 Tax=Leptolyngbya foveolarum TaxID=47253 RepID=A0A2W4WPT1_9CYAN|nr:MAG: threonine-phosphate decarboxylase [Leptolyngbya foveolarum]
MSRPVHGGNLAWAAGLAHCAPAELLDFSASISPLGPPRSVRAAVQADFLSVRDYPDPAYGDLRRAIAHHHKVPIESVMPGNGAAELLTWAARDLAQMETCFCLSPGFSDYDRALQAFGCVSTKLPCFNASNWQESLLGQSLDLEQCGLLLNNPHNPTGMLFDREQIRSVLSRVGLVVVDEAFMDFLPPERSQSVIDWISEFENLVVIRSLTKFYSMPGLRLGYAIAQPKTLKRWQTWRDPWSVNTLAISAGIAALQDTKFQRQTWDWLAAANRQMYKSLAAIPELSPLPGCVNFFLVACEKSVTALQENLLKRHRIYIRDCMSFEGLGDRYFRVAVKMQDENLRLVRAIADVLPHLPEASDVI